MSTGGTSSPDSAQTQNTQTVADYRVSPEVPLAVTAFSTFLQARRIC
jgi:hypothetical protein